LFAWNVLRLSWVWFGENRKECTKRRSTRQARQAPAAQKNHDARPEQPRARPHRARREQIDEEQPHTDQLRESADVERAPRHQIRSKFFSISRRVNRSITGRPCGQIVEYAVARSSSRMCVIFSYVSG